MRLTIAGCSGSFAGPASPASSYLVQAEQEGRTWSVVLDLGSGALGALQRHMDLADLDAVFVSHLHPDHCIDVCGLYVTRKYHPSGPVPGRLPVYAPQGAEKRFALMYHGLEGPGMRSEFAVHELADAQVTEVGPLRITAYHVNHPVEAFGFRVEADGVVLAYSGDTDTCDALGPLLTGADLALVDSAFIDGRDDARGVHLSGSRAARAALDAGGVRRLVLTHIPAWNDREVCRAQAAAVWPGVVELAEPDATYEVGGNADGVRPDEASGRELWAGYLAAHADQGTVGDDVPVEWFGDSAALADELFAFVESGTKRATAGLVAEYQAAGEPLPRVGGHWVACDGSGRARAVLRTTELRLGPLSSVDERFAWDEGEYDRTLQSWLEGHRRAFRRSCERLGVEFDEDIEVCFERFQVVWPPELAD
jgi:ribonuclease BN (tRNA processing enzyme)/uncharacterized protein YhfF